MIRLYYFFKYLILISFVFFFSYCNSQSSSGKTNQDTVGSADSVVKDVPEFFQGKIWKSYFSKVQALLGIQPIENGFRDWQIRLWIGHGYTSTDSSQLIIFKKEDNKISGTLYTYIHPYNSTFDTATTLVRRSNSLTPQTGWRNFINSIEMLGIYDLPDYKKLSGYYLATDSYGVTVEVATKNKYRVYDYPDYEGYIDKISEAGKMFKIMKLIEDEFKIKVIY